MWERGHLYVLLLVITFHYNNDWGLYIFSALFVVLFLFFWRNVSSLCLLVFFVVLAMMFWDHCV